MKKVREHILHVYIVALYHKLRKWMTESLNDLIIPVLAYYEICFKIVI